jgi:UDP-N-acetylmuramyl pentapeptide phosphotransferase/UDP-N-acetylglucosamine-1-phosphate transferase
MTGDVFISLSASALAFLKYNFSPALIFMGDMGSMFLVDAWLYRYTIAGRRTLELADSFGIYKFPELSVHYQHYSYFGLGFACL